MKSFFEKDILIKSFLEKFLGKSFWKKFLEKVFGKSFWKKFF
jgi:hypothetical protein